MALFRVYENGKPIDSKDYLKWNPKGAADEELVFVSGPSGSTQRLDTVAQLTYQRDIGFAGATQIYRTPHRGAERILRQRARAGPRGRLADLQL